MRAAIYARFSSDLQKVTSLEDQIAVARRYAEGQGWTILADHVYTDAAFSGASLERPGIQALLAAANRSPRPFDVLLVDDSSRISRDLPDALRVMQQLRFLGVRVLYLSQGIDSASAQADTLVTIHGMVDSVYLREMAAKIKRGLAGQHGRGYATGAATFGYRTAPVLDPSGKLDANGYPALIGKRVEIHPAEAPVVVTIFEWYAAGLGIGTVVDRLNVERYRGPRGARWRAGAVKRLIANEKYRGFLMWGQRTFERRPGTRQLVARAVPRERWHVLERPDLRIVSDDLWARVQARRVAVRKALPPGHSLMRGRNAALHSPHLFSGFMKCASCGGAVVVVSGGGGSPRYGCLRNSRNGATFCPNRLTIRAKVADAHLLEGLQAELLSPATVAFITNALGSALSRRLDERPRLAAETQRARADTEQRLQRLVDAIEQGVAPSTLAQAIEERRAELARLTELLADLTEPVPPRLALMPGWVRQQLEDIVGLLKVSPERTKAEFQRLQVRVSMACVTAEGGRPFYRATVESALPALLGVSDLGQQVPTVDRLNPQSAGSSTVQFDIDLPANQLGPGWRKRA